MLLVLDRNYPSSKAGGIPNGVDSCFTHLCSWQLTKARNTNLGRFLSAFKWICFPNVTAWGSSRQPVLPLPREAFLDLGWLKIAAKAGNLNSPSPRPALFGWRQFCLALTVGSFYGHFGMLVTCQDTGSLQNDQSWGCCFLIQIFSSRDFGTSLLTNKKS